MARPTKQRPPVKQEAEEMEAQEMGETSEEETREGTEDGASMKSSRKRSPKGAKNTKAPMDAECGTCKSGKPCSCKAKKDGGCGGYGKRGDALTPQEYLAACDLGIQDRSRTYIRARLDATDRLDLKCGAGSISEGEKCTKGSAQKVQGKGGGNGLKTAVKIAAGVALVGAGAYGATKVSKALNARSLQAKSKMRSARKLREQGESTMYAARKRNVNALKNESPKATPEQMKAADIKAELRLANAMATKAGARSQARTLIAEARRQAPPSKARMRRSVNRVLTRGISTKRDSMFAAGFTPDFDQLAI